MANVQYGKAYHTLKNFATPLIMAPCENGNAIAAGTYFSPELRDIKVAAGGQLTEVVGPDGNIDAIQIAAEFVTITLTVMPSGSSNTQAALGINLTRIGTPWIVTAPGPSVVMMGHSTNTFIGGASIFASGTVMHIESHDLDFSVEGNTTGTITFKLRPSLFNVKTPIG